MASSLRQPTEKHSQKDNRERIASISHGDRVCGLTQDTWRHAERHLRAR